jgi:hypothetical protein
MHMLRHKTYSSRVATGLQITLIFIFITVPPTNEQAREALLHKDDVMDQLELQNWNEMVILKPMKKSLPSSTMIQPTSILQKHFLIFTPILNDPLSFT